MSRTFIFSGIICCLWLLTFSEGSASKSCPSGWKLYGNNHCYRVFYQKKGFYEAIHYCQIHNGQLVKINSQAKSNFVKGMAKSYGQYWIGVYDVHLDGVYTYIDESHLWYSNWNPGEPSSSYEDNEHCVMMYGDSGKWNNLPCGERNPFFCEKYAQ